MEHEGKRLILQRNEAVRAREAQRRADKLERLQATLAQRNAKVTQSTRAKPEAGLAQLTAWVKRHKLHSYVTLTLQERTLQCTVDEAALAHSALLDGCYTLETDVPATQMKADTVDARYRDLQQVERNFRTLKTDFLEVRPLFLRKANRTRAHVFVALLALKLTRLFEQKLRAVFGTTDRDPMSLTVADALVALSRITYLYYHVYDRTYARLPRLDELQLAIFDALVQFHRRLCAMNESCHNQNYETSTVYWPSVEPTTSAVGKRSPFARCFHVAPLPDSLGERPRRTPVGDCRPPPVWNPDGAQRHPRLSHRSGRVFACSLLSAQQYHTYLGCSRL